MPKKCIICEAQAEFCIKDSSECYCKECAVEHFADLELLQKIEEDAAALKSFVDSNKAKNL